jgi:hypothetical protein
MDTTMDRAGLRTRRGVRRSSGGSIVELMMGGGAILLPILALLGVLPMTFAAIAYIAIGAGMMMQGESVGAMRSYGEQAELRHGMSAEIMGGAAVVILGILALLRMAPVTLLAIAAIVAGGSIVFGGATTSRFGQPRLAPGADVPSRNVMNESVNAAAGGDVLVGLAGLVLGILVLAGVGSAAVHVTLLLVASLALGAGLFLDGSIGGARTAATLRR